MQLNSSGPPRAPSLAASAAGAVVQLLAVTFGFAGLRRSPKWSSTRAVRSTASAEVLAMATVNVAAPPISSMWRARP